MNNRVITLLLVVALCVAAYIYSDGDIHFGGIKPKALTVELGAELPQATKYYGKADVDTRIIYYSDGITIEEPHEVGDYDVDIILANNRVLKTTLKIQDTSAPTFKVQPIVIKKGEQYDPTSFILPNSAFDLSGYIEYSFTDDKFGHYTEVGTYFDIGIKATDKYNNSTILYTTLVIS